MRRINVILLEEQDQFVRKFQVEHGIRSIDETLNKLLSFYTAKISRTSASTNTRSERITAQLRKGELINETDSIGLS